MSEAAQGSRPTYRIGADENGLGARLGPLLVTAVLARVDAAGQRALSRRLPRRIGADLDDSKRLVTFKNHALGEAWARALYPEAQTPTQLFRSLNLTPETQLRQRCPRHSEKQCWSTDTEEFCADDATVRRVSGHVLALRRRGIQLLGARTESLCVRQLNDERAAGANRFVSDLHAMERLVLALRQQAGGDVEAICGKVGGIADYERYFGPLSGRLRVCLQRSRRRSAYRFVGVGELHFVQDADGSDPLVMLASLIGKYIRELTMSRISGFYAARSASLEPCSGYHDPVTTRFIQLTTPSRRRLRISNACFERASDS